MAKLLLIDDDPTFTFALSLLLQRGGHEALIANRAEEALLSVKASCFDVALLDMRLPDGDGLRLLEQLAAVDPMLPVICLTGLEDTSTVVQAMRSGAVDYLTKPVDRQTLFNAVTSAADFSSARRAGADRSQDLAVPVGESPAWKRSVELISAAAGAPKTTVLLTGEPGVGKEVAANLLHRMSKRRNAPLVSANAACFSPSLMESELFGHEAGAFTGAHKRRRGLFEQAEGGFLFLDEIGELALDLQSKLLRVLEGHPFRRVGGEEALACDVRLICATNRDLPELVRRGAFRADLFERLRVFEIPLPPLRERREDITHLVHHFVAKLGQEVGMPAAGVSAEALEALRQHAWPGNVRELRNVIERALVLSAGETITPRHLPHELWRASDAASLPSATDNLTLEELTRRHIVAVFQQTGGNVTRSAERLGVSRLALRKRLQAYGLRPVRS
ncbi:MAG: sigma-54-dependent Fis family transcriptional regulator [Archangium sp.]|nr:sigma-54-dependent Fis family transcriptional regulator [Archangium sp.]